MKKFFYIADISAEDCCIGTVYLTESEHKVVKNFIEQVNSFASGYCGSCCIGNEKFVTKEEALKNIDKFYDL